MLRTVCFALTSALLLGFVIGERNQLIVESRAFAQAPQLPDAKMPKGKPAIDEGVVKRPAPQKHGRGPRHPAEGYFRDAVNRVNEHRHRALRAAVPVTTLTAYDARTGTFIPPVGNQGQCGDCYCWSGCKVGTSANIAVGKLPAGSMLSVQYMNDYHPELGGCDGGDEAQVAGIIHSSGCPSLAQYPGAGQGPGQKQPVAGLTMYTVDSLVYVGDQSGVAATQDIKNYLAYFRQYVSVAADASNWDNVGPNSTITGNGTSIDHAIGLVGFDDNHDNGDGSKGAWIMQNNWDVTWGNQGYAWIKYGADSIGTEAFICLVGNGPTPPGPPVPPTPPTPPPVPPGPTPTGNVTLTLPDGGTIVYQATYTPASANSNVLNLANLLPRDQSLLKGLYNDMQTTKLKLDVMPKVK